MMSKFLAVNSSIYRMIYSSVTRYVIYHYTTDECKQFDDFSDPGNCIINRLEDRYRYVADHHGEMQLKNLISKYDGRIKIAIVDPTTQTAECERNENYRFRIEGSIIQENTLTLCESGKGDEYKEIHPPSYVYQWYA
mgnify:CR=1 FL=1